MPMYVPQLDKTVFTAPQPRDYMSAAIDIANKRPDYMQKFNDARKASMERQILQQKYEQDLLKSQQYLEMYPDYRDAQTAELRARAAKANAMVPMYSAHADYYRAGTGSPVGGDTGIIKPIAAMPGGEEAAVIAPVQVSPRRTDVPVVEPVNVWDQGL